jgi:hypothetical protein
MKTSFGLGIAVLIFLGGFVFSAVADAPDITGRIAVFSLSRLDKADKDRDVLFDSPVATYCESALQEFDLSACISPPTPLTSRELLQYTLVENSGLRGKDTKTGRLFLEIGADGSARVEAESGLPAFTTVEISSIDWMIDREKAIQSLQKSECRYALLVTATAQDQSSALSSMKSGDFETDTKTAYDTSRVLANQRSVRSFLSMSLVDVKTGVVVRSFADDMPVMDLNSLHAATKGWKNLIRKAFQEWFQSSSR